MFEGSSLAIQGNAMTPQSLELMSGPMQAQAMVQIEKVVATGLVANTREQARSLLAHTALLNAGALSAMQEHLTMIAPTGANRYSAIVDAYCLGAAQAIARW
jgi:hypothetical protein